MSNKEKIFDYLLNKLNYNLFMVCGIMSNMYFESGYNPDINGDNGTSYGLCQWHNGRKNNLFSFCNTKNLNYKSIEGQLEYLHYELTTSYKTVYNKICGAVNSYDVGYYFCRHFEIPANTISASEKRGKYAEELYKSYSHTVDKIVDKSIMTLADEVIHGLWGNGDDRYNRLTNAGYNYQLVQNKVNELLGVKPKENKKSNEDIAKEVIRGSWGNGIDRYKNLTKAGYNYQEIQDLVNKILLG